MTSYRSRYETLKFFLALVVGVAPSVGPASIPLEDPARKLIRGDILSNDDSKKLLFSFVREPEVVKDQLRVTRSYKDPSGKLVAVETLIFEKGQLKKFDVDQKQLNESGSLEVKDGRLFFSYTKDGKTKASNEKLEEPFVIADTVTAFLHKNWGRLQKGETLKARFPVHAERETFGFRFQKEPDSTFNGQPVHVVKMSASSPFVRLVVNPLYFYFETSEQKQVIRVVGRTVPKVQVNGKWNDLEADIRFTHELK